MIPARNEMPVEEDLPEIILAKTREGKLAWERLSAGGFLVLLGFNTITIDRTSASITIRIVNSDGLTIQTFNSQQRRDQIIEELYDLARRQALKIDETLLDVKRSLDNL
jgi:hypothetical protein